MILTDRDIWNEVADGKLVRDFVDASVQIQPHGVDLTVGEIEELAYLPGTLDFDNSDRVLPKTVPVKFYDTGHGERQARHLARGVYIVRTNETIDLSEGFTMARALPRSSLLRMGCTVETAVFDAGYVGKPQLMLHVINPSGLTIYRNARFAQLVFEELLDRPAALYDGQYQGEGVDVEIISLEEIRGQRRDG